MMAAVSDLNTRAMCESCDLIVAGIADGRAFRILTLLDGYIRECLTIFVDRRITSQDVVEQLFYLFVSRGIPKHILI